MAWKVRCRPASPGSPRGGSIMAIWTHPGGEVRREKVAHRGLGWTPLGGVPPGMGADPVGDGKKPGGGRPPGTLANAEVPSSKPGR